MSAGAGARGVLTVNAGSTSVKVSLVRSDGSAEVLDDLAHAVAAVSPTAVLHRVVHGGDRSAPAVVDAEVLAELRALTELAPLHQPASLAALETARAAFPDVPHIACFDTSFHRTLPASASTYALPEALRAHVRVYGFHGLSHAYAARRVRELVPAARRVVVAHLGGGASLCAVLDGRSIDTTMGFTPLDGLVMGTRCGHLDPGALLWLAAELGSDLDALTDLLERRSGLLGLSGSGDMREVLRRRDAGHEEAALAVAVYQHALQAQVGAMVAGLRGLDVLVLTGGVGEHCREVGNELCAALSWLGVDALEPGDEGLRVADGVRDLSAPGARVRTLVVHAREDLQMLAEAAHLLP